MQQDFAELRHLLAGDPSYEVWLGLLEKLFSWKDGGTRRVALRYAQEHLEGWPDEQRLISPWLTSKLCGDDREAALDMEHPVWQLARSVVWSGPKDVDWGKLKKLPQLRSLRLWHLPATAINWGALAQLKELEHLELEHITLSKGGLDWGALGQLRQLKRLHLHHLDIESIDWDVIARYQSLSELHLDHLFLATIRWDVLVQMGSLERLHLHQMNIDSLDWGVLVQLRKLRHLHLGGLLRAQIDWEALGKMENLEVLEMMRLSISDFGWRSISNLRKLQKLHLEELPISELDWEVLSDLPELRSLYLSRVPLLQLGEISRPSSLRQLGLVDCHIYEISVPSTLGELRSLDLSYNSVLQRLDLCCVPELRSLSLSGCERLRDIQGGGELLYRDGQAEVLKHPHLLVLAGREVGSYFPLFGEATRLGGIGATQVDLSFDDDGISRHHCTIERREGGHYLCDAGSGSGTILNGVDVQEAPLVDGDCIRLGQTILRWCHRRS